MLDIDIDQLRLTNRVSVSRGGSVDIVLAVKNNGTADGIANATVVGMQNGVQVYAETISVSDPVGNGRTTITFPPFTPAVARDITWRATIDDEDPDIDVASGLTRVVP